MPAADNAFPHLTFERVVEGRARLHGGHKKGARETANLADRPAHDTFLRSSFRQWSDRWSTIEQDRAERGLPPLPTGRPLVLLVEKDADVDFLRSAFEFEIIAEEDDGYVLVATGDVTFEAVKQVLQKFVEEKRGGGNAAKLYDICDRESAEARLKRVLSERLYRLWPSLAKVTSVMVDISVSFGGKTPLPKFTPPVDDREDESYKKYLKKYLTRHGAAVCAWDESQQLNNE